MKQMAINFASILPELYSSDLDRKSMWERMGNGIISACKKCGGDYEEFVNMALEFIKSNPAMVASNDRLSEWLLKMDIKSDDEKKMFLRVIEKKHNVVLVYARGMWNDIKDAKRPLKDGE